MIFLMDSSGTKARRASLISFFSAGFFSGLKQSPPGPSQLTQARRIAFSFLRRLRAGHESGDLAFLLHLPIDEILDVGMIGIDDDHFGGAPRRAAGFDRAGGAIADLQERHQAGGFAAARKLLVLAAQFGKIRAGARAIFEQARFAHPKIHDAAVIDEIVGDGLDETGMRLGMLIGGLRLDELFGLVVDVIMALARTIDPIGPMEAGVEPLR